MLTRILPLLAVTLAAATLSPLGVASDNERRIVRLATTTSTENSGLLGFLMPEFEKDTGYKLHVIAVGTGKALRIGQEGDVDVVMVHARAAEERFVAAGYGVNRRDVMYNDFVVVGPSGDLANIAVESKAHQAFAKIAASESLFLSRGDDSGTHKKELAVWEAAGSKPSGTWYREAGQGMGKVLQMAGELGAYTLTDRGTWLYHRDKNSLRLLFEGDPQIHNPYGIIAVNPARYPDTNHRGAMALIAWLTSSRGQALIQAYKIKGEQAFFSSAPS